MLRKSYNFIIHSDRNLYSVFWYERLIVCSKPTTSLRNMPQSSASKNKPRKNGLHGFALYPGAPMWKREALLLYIVCRYEHNMTCLFVDIVLFWTAENMT
jgi:hypothetical protein